MVDSRWATAITVFPANSFRITDWITLSVSESMFAVASSNTKMGLFFRSTLAKQMSCFSPALNWLSEEFIIVLRLFLNWVIILLRWGRSPRCTLSRGPPISQSLWIGWEGQRLLGGYPWTRTGSEGSKNSFPSALWFRSRAYSFHWWWFWSRKLFQPVWTEPERQIISPSLSFRSGLSFHFHLS